MPRPRKLMFHNHVLFVSTSVEEGLVFPPNRMINLILEGCMARAQELYPVEINHYLFQTTHAHFIMTVRNPDDIKGFLERFKTESAHCINRLLGRRKRTLWCAGYDSPILLTLETVKDKIKYIYNNPTADNLVDTIDVHPGISSWKYLKQGRVDEVTKECPWIRRIMLFKLEDTELSLQEFKTIAKMLKKEATESHTLTIKPNGWMSSFDITDPEEQKQVNEYIMDEVYKEEDLFREVRNKANQTVIGSDVLRLTPMDTPYQPDRTGKRMLCISSDVDLRKIFISIAKDLFDKARMVYINWLKGDYTEPFPIGLYPPSLPKTANLILLDIGY